MLVIVGVNGPNGPDRRQIAGKVHFRQYARLRESSAARVSAVEGNVTGRGTRAGTAQRPARPSTDSLRAPDRRRLYQQLADRLLDYIEVTGLAVGDRLPSERDLAKALQVSRASVRQATVARSPLLAEFMAALAAPIAETRRSSLSEPDRPPRSLHAHQRILEAIRNGDAAGARQAMRRHVKMVADIGLLRWSAPDQ